MIKKGLTGNQLKLIALLAMTVDHIGMELFSQNAILRLIGRLAYPIFAYMIAEGCRHTRSMPRYLGTMAPSAAVCQMVYLVMMGSVYQCILVTFSLSIGLIWLIQNAREKKRASAWLLTGAGFAGVVFICEGLPRLLSGTDFRVDYGIVGVLVPVLIYLGKGRGNSLLMTTLGLACLAEVYGIAQWFALLALPLLALYNGQRGKWKMKAFFYLYFPAHLLVLHIIQTIFF